MSATISKFFTGVLLAMLAGMVSLAPISRAAIVAGGNGEQTSSNSPAGIPGYHHVAQLGVGNGIYLGDRWMLTAAHVSGGNPALWSVTLTGQTYTQDPNTPEIRVLNPDGTGADLTIRRLATAPNLPSLVIGATPGPKTPITTVGFGVSRAAAPTIWHYNKHDTSIAWSETSDPTRPESTLGYKWGTLRAKRWGTNVTEALVDDGTLAGGPLYYFQYPGAGNTQLFGSEFTNNGSITESALADMDSGGAAFDNRNRLIGVNLYINYFTGQPTQTSVFGNYAYYGNLASYADNIAAQTRWAPSILGDANLDGVVNGTDAKILYSNYGSGSKWSQGDFDLNGLINFNDYQILEANFGSVYTALASDSPMTHGGSGDVSSVPEPSFLALAGIALGRLLVRRRR